MKRTKNILLLLVIFQFLNCNNWKKNESDSGISDNKISDSIKINIINEILENNIAIIRNKNALIVHHKLMQNFDHWIESGDSLIEVSQLNYLSNILKEKDTLFIKHQIEQLKAFSLKGLEPDGYNIFDFKHYINEDIEIDSIIQIAELRNFENGIDNQALQFLYGPIMNKKKNKVYLKIDTPYSGNTYLFEKKDGVWTKKNIGNWME